MAYPLHTAVRSYDGDLYPIKMLLKQKDIDINSTNSEGKTPLHLAARNETCFSKELIQFLLDNGANINDVDANGDNALHLIAQNTAPFLCQLTKPIFSKESYETLKEKPKSFDKRGVPIRVPLSESLDIVLRSGGYVTVPRSIPESAKILLERGLDVNTANFLGNTALHFATQNEIWCYHLLRMFLKKSPDVNAQNFMGETPLHWVVRSHGCTISMVKLLLDNGANVNLQDENGDNIYETYSLTVTEKDAMLDILLQSQVQNHINSSLHVASLCHDVQSVEKLLSDGANVNDVVKFGYSPLFYAIIVYTDTTEKITNKTKVVKLLLQYGADINHIFPRFNNPTKYIFDYYMSLETLGFGGLIEANHQEDENMFAIFYNHKAKLLALHEKRVKMGILNVPMFKEPNVQRCGVVEPLNKKFKGEQNKFIHCCEDELTAMGNTKLEGTDVTFLDLMLADDKKTMSYVKQPKLMESFLAKKDNFPLYIGMLEIKLAKALKRNNELESMVTN